MSPFFPVSLPFEGGLTDGRTMMLRGLLTMSTDELERLSVIQKIVDKNLTQVLAAKQLGLKNIF